jgi:hypothetical protein
MWLEYGREALRRAEDEMLGELWFDGEKRLGDKTLGD